jgi:uncharacterized protein YkwD
MKRDGTVAVRRMKDRRSYRVGVALLSVLWLAVVLLGLAGCGGGGDAPATDGSATAVAGTGATAPPSTALDASTTCGIPNYQALMLQQINTARAQARSCGATAYAATTALAWNDQLFAAAARHSADMAVNNYFSHVGRDGRSPSDRVTAEGYTWRTTGENIAAGYGSIDTVMAGWLASPGHCANIMNTGYADVAVACVQATGATFSTYWTMELARR